jgi:hypothetical protein
VTPWRRFWRCAALSTLLLVPRPLQAQMATAPQAAIAVSERPESELLLLAVQLGHMDLDAVLPAYWTGTRALIPLGAFCRALGLAVEVDPERGSADGFLISEKRVFRVDVPTRQLRIGAQSFTFDSTAIEIHSNDIYVPLAMLAAWLNADIRLDRNAAALIVRSGERMPIQAQRERRLRAQKDLARSALPRPDYPRVETARGAWSVPFVDQSFRSTSIDTPTKHSDDWEYSTYLAGDVLYMDGDARLNGNNAQPLNEARGGLGRTELDPILLGPLHARQVRVGEILSPGLDLVGNSAFGPGFHLSSYPLQQPDQFDRHVFRGPLAPGWDVELYRDDALIGYQGSRPDGMYEFDVPLTLGVNPFRLVFYGPGGERREDTRAFNVGTSLAPPGQRNYRLVICDPTGRAPRSYLETSFSLARRLSASCGLAAMGNGAGAQEYATGGLRGAWSRSYATADVALDRDGGVALQGGLQTLCGPMSFTLRRAQLHQFASEVFRPVFGSVQSRSSIRIDGVVPAPWIMRIPVQAELSMDRLSSGQWIRFLTNRVGFGIRQVSVSHQMRQTQTGGPGATLNPQVLNTLLLSTRVRRFGLRGALDYEPGNQQFVNSLNLIAEAPLVAGSYAGVGINQDLQTDEIRYLLSLRQGQGPLGWNLGSEYGRQSGSTVSLGLSMGLGHDPRLDRWHPDARPVARAGAASVRVFLDDDGDGVRGPDELPIGGARFALNGGSSTARTGRDGVAYLGGLPEGTPVDVTLLPGSLEDPLWLPQRPGVTIVPRAGRTALIDFPVRVTGEVAGTILVRRQGVVRPAAAMTVELLDARSNEIVKQAKTLYDGSYDLAGVFPGRYALRAAPSVVAQLGLLAQPARMLEITAEATILDGIDLTLEETSAIVGDDR